MTLIYKIVSQQQWQAVEAAGVFRGSEVDRADGYIHFSSADQVAETVAKHFSGRDDLLIVSVDSELLAATLKWEPSRGGALFPHLYDELRLQSVLQVRPLADFLSE